VHSALVDTPGDQRTTIVHGVALISDAVRAIKRLKRALETRGLIGVHGEERLALANGVTGLRVQVDTGSVLDGVLLARTTGAESPGGDTERQSFLLHENTIAVGGDNVTFFGLRQLGIRVSTLSLNHATPGIHRLTIVERCFDVSIGVAD
jgi:hypothetical protein